MIARIEIRYEIITVYIIDWLISYREDDDFGIETPVQNKKFVLRQVSIPYVQLFKYYIL